MQEHQAESNHTVPCLTSSMGCGGGYVPLLKLGFVNTMKENSEIKKMANYSPSGHNASSIVESSGISPTVMENHGTVTGVAIPVSLSRGCIEEEEVAHCLSAEGPAKEGVNTHQAMNRVAIPIMNPSLVNKQQNGRRFKEDQEPMFTLTAQDIHGVGLKVNQIGQRFDTSRKNCQRNRVYDPNGLSPCLNAGMGEGGNIQPQIPVGIDPEVVGDIGEMKSNGGSQFYQQDRVYDGSKVATSLSSQLPGGGQMYSVPLGVLRNTRSEYGKEIRKEYESGNISISRHEFLEKEIKEDGNINTLDSVTKDNLLAVEVKEQNMSDQSMEKKSEKNMQPFPVGITIADPNDTKEHPDIYVQLSEDLTVYAIWYEKYNCYITIRKLTPKECFRLQGFSDELFEKAAFVNSDSQLYKQAGNAVSVPIPYEIGKRLAEY